MQIPFEYISMNYMTLMLLAGLTVIMIANRRTKIESIVYIYAITELVVALTLVEYLEVWCDTYNKPVWILYLIVIFNLIEQQNRLAKMQSRFLFSKKHF